MKAHLDQTLAEAAHELNGQYAAGVADYEAIHHHILMMADTLSAGIVAAVPVPVPMSTTRHQQRGSTP